MTPPPNTITAAIYARVSTLDQNAEMQLCELREYASRRGWVITNEYIDRGISGSRESRPELNRLMRDAQQRSFDTVLVWKVDRFGRSLRHLVNALADLGALGVAFVSLRDNLDLTTPSGRLMFAVIGAMAEFERSLIQERVRAGIAHAKAQGQKLGRPLRVLDGNELLRMRAEGASLRQIATQLNAGYGTIRKRLRRLAANRNADGVSPAPMLKQSGFTGDTTENRNL
jgi:DNA invertase Pin-like site-specific DNA recombinase